MRVATAGAEATSKSALLLGGAPGWSRACGDVSLLKIGAVLVFSLFGVLFQQGLLLAFTVALSLLNFEMLIVFSNSTCNSHGVVLLLF